MILIEKDENIKKTNKVLLQKLIKISKRSISLHSNPNNNVKFLINSLFSSKFPIFSLKFPIFSNKFPYFFLKKEEYKPN